MMKRYLNTYNENWGGHVTSCSTLNAFLNDRSFDGSLRG